MIGGEQVRRALGAEIERTLHDVPYDVARTALYSGRELFDVFDPEDPSSRERCLDAVVARHLGESGGENPSMPEMLARRLHDLHVRQAALSFLAKFPRGRVAGIMGGHALSRRDSCYRRAVVLAKTLTERGYLMLSGGGPGAMEATHLGAWLAGRPDGDVASALAALPDVAAEDPRWLASAFETMDRFPQDAPRYSLSIPTWHYGNEPPTPFATHIAKLFDNSIREDTLLSESRGGLVFMPGGPGTVQEAVDVAAKNHYGAADEATRMVFVDRAFWTVAVPLHPFFEQLRDRGRYRNLDLHLEDDTEAILRLFP